MIGTSWRMSCLSTSSGVIIADSPRMNSTLKMLLPTTLATAMSVLPAQADCTDTASSGELVPNATMVRPTTSGEMPKDSAKFRGAAHQDHQQHSIDQFIERRSVMPVHAHQFGRARDPIGNDPGNDPGCQNTLEPGAE
jgi:hypothetical protein